MTTKRSSAFQATGECSRQQKSWLRLCTGANAEVSC